MRIKSILSLAFICLAFPALADVSLKDTATDKIEVRRKGGETTVLVPEAILEAAGWHFGKCPITEPCPLPPVTGDPDPVGTLVWSDFFLQEIPVPREANEAGAGDPPVVYGGDAVGNFSYPEPGVLRTYVTKAEDLAGGRHHTMFQPGFAPPYLGPRGWVMAFDRSNTYRFDFDVLVERQAPDPKWNVVFQTKTWPDAGERTNNPTFAIYTKNGHWWLEQRGDGDATVDDKLYDRFARVDLGPINYDTWTAWRIDIRFDWDPRGAVTVSQNGDQLWTAENVRTTYRDTAPGGVNLGYGQYEYFSSGSPDWRAVRFRNIRIYDLGQNP